MIIYALYNIKGGVGKTSAAVNLAWLSAQDKKTLLIDLDPQSASSFYFRIRPPKKHSAIKLVTKPNSLQKYIRGTDFDNLDLLPADFSYRNLDLDLQQNKNSRSRLQRNFQVFADEYERIIIDCPPNITLVSENIFRAADLILVPTIPTFLSQLTLEKLIAFFREEKISRKKIWPFFSMVERRKKVHLSKMEEMKDEKRILLNYVPYLSDIERMGEERAPISFLKPRSVAANAYKNLWLEINSRLVEESHKRSKK